MIIQKTTWRCATSGCQVVLLYDDEFERGICRMCQDGEPINQSRPKFWPGQYVVVRNIRWECVSTLYQGPHETGLDPRGMIGQVVDAVQMECSESFDYVVAFNDLPDSHPNELSGTFWEDELRDFYEEE